MNEKIGAVGPTANLAGEAQRVGEVTCRLGRPGGGATGARSGLSTEDVDEFARAVREAQRGQWKAVEVLGGFCWLARREVLRQVPFFRGDGDEFDERKFSDGVRKAGYQLAICRDLYVLHFGSNVVGE